MNCPVDQSELRMTDRQGVEIDYCPQCRGVWLDRGELDKLIEREAAMTAAPPAGGPSFGERRAYERDEYRQPGPYRRYDDDDDDDREGYRGRRRRGWLGDIFDFG